MHSNFVCYLILCHRFALYPCKATRTLHTIIYTYRLHTVTKEIKRLLILTKVVSISFNKYNEYIENITIIPGVIKMYIFS